MSSVFFFSEIINLHFEAILLTILWLVEAADSIRKTLKFVKIQVNNELLSSNLNPL